MNDERAPVDAVLALLAARPATLGAGRLVCVDGPAGSGKTTLGRALAGAAGASLVHLDDLYDGWSGLDRLDRQLATLLRPLAAGRPGTYRRYDWHVGDFAETVVVPPSALLVVEGVGSGWAAFADLVTVLVWVEAPPDLRLRRGLERDGEEQRHHWLAWQRAEDAHHARHGTRDRADLVVDGAAALPKPPDVAEDRGI